MGLIPLTSSFDATLTLTSADSLLTEAGLHKMRIDLWLIVSFTARAVKHILQHILLSSPPTTKLLPFPAHN